MNYYNENDKYAAEWLQNLIADGRIPAGEVDTRSIEDVRPADLAGFTQHHFFAGVGGWPLALALAGWSPSRPAFTGSCPCQPFSAAGKGAGTDDERHLWPAFHHLISQLRPSVIFGEQVASKQALEWWDIVSSDLEGSGYACAAADLPAASVEAPHLRSRLFWVATRATRRYGAQKNIWEFDELSNTDLQRCNGQRIQPESGQKGVEVARNSSSDSMANDDKIGRERSGNARGRSAGLTHYGADGSMADNNSEVFRREKEPANYAGQEKDRSASDAWRRGEIDRPNPSESFWANADWVGCTDGNWRAAKPGTRVLDARVSGRVVIQRPDGTSHAYSARSAIKGFGNAIVPQVAAEFIRSLM